MKIISVLALLLLVSPTLGFWSTGHMIIARIAHEEIKAKDPKYHATITKEIELLKDFAQEEINPFVESAVWADDNKAIAWGAFSNWHFVDTPVIAEGFEGEYEVDNANATWAIYEMRKTLKNMNKPKFNSGLALSFAWRYLIHLVGDIHQPLHASALYSDQFPHGDRGGNSFKITYPADKQVKNLHALWDSCVDQYGSIWAPVSDEEWNLLGKYSDDIKSEYPRSRVDKRVKVLDEREWAKESNKIATEVVYADIEPNTTPSEEYITRGREVVNEQLAVAGYRLADLMLQLRHYVSEGEEVESFMTE
ncbi:unnamed protein product [Moneuplotes crassus]|uniref:S1/P1 Nuclease n=1 Tax=Euplotes crassus TaxID=5936 RepID=A0AAD1XNZ8_EUPCR|nr:unnamed protein product [Moneuplotes crassus]